MKSGNYKKIAWPVELFLLMLVASEIIFILRQNILQEYIALVAVQTIIYLLLSLVFYHLLTPEVLFSKSNAQIKLKMKEITEETSGAFLKKVVLYVSLIKLTILILFPLLILSARVLKINPFFLIVLDLMAVFYCIIACTKYLALAKGYHPESLKDVISLMLYYNPEDKRAVVDKPIGIGSTINIATKQGKIILATILGIPLTIVLILIIVLALSGKF